MEGVISVLARLSRAFHARKSITVYNRQFVIKSGSDTILVNISENFKCLKISYESDTSVLDLRNI